MSKWGTVTQEKWALIKLDGKETKYAISSHGRIKNIRNGKLRKTSFQEKQSNIEIFTFKLDDGKHTSRTVAQLVATAFLPIKPDPYARLIHLDGDRSNNHDTNLEWVVKYSDKQIRKACMLICKEEIDDKEIATQVQMATNVVQRIRLGLAYRQTFDEIRGKFIIKDGRGRIATHSDNIIHQACKLIEDGWRNIDISIDLKIHQTLISAIRHGRVHRHISQNYNLRHTPVKKY